MKEIGGYFGLEQLVSQEYYPELTALNSGRNALLYLLKARAVKKIHLPIYLCDSVRKMCIQNGFSYQLYHTDEHFQPQLEFKPCCGEYLYIVNYFGQIPDEEILKWQQKYENIIVDNTQAFFQKPIAGIDTIYSCRKYFGVPDGAYLSTAAKLAETLAIDFSNERMSHILGRFEKTAAEFYPHFMASDQSFTTEPLKFMSKLTHNLLGAIDYDRVCLKRNQNFIYLADALAGVNRIALTVPQGPFAYPLYVENGIEIRKLLAKKCLYIPTLWPNVLIESSRESTEYKFAANILPLPCDQRYGRDEMKFICQEIFQILGGRQSEDSVGDSESFRR